MAVALLTHLSRAVFPSAAVPLAKPIYLYVSTNSLVLFNEHRPSPLCITLRRTALRTAPHV